jgi:3-oxoacyl-[acyl-carrier protein] reductase
MTAPADTPVVWITGAAGGLGAGLVHAFATAGWHVAASVHRQPLGAVPGDVLSLTADVTDREQAGRAVEDILTRWGRLDVLVNNAGLARDEALWQMEEEQWDAVLDVNLRGAFLCSQAAIRPMMKRRDGHILNLGSFSGRCGARGQANYAAAKAGLLGLTQSLAREVGSRNVRVNTVLPGVLLPGVLPTAMTASLPPGILADFAAANALGRLNSIPEVAGFILFLAGTRNISGQLFQLDSRIAPWS